MANNRDDFSKETISIIASRAGWKCSFPGCNRETVGPHSNNNKRISIGEAAHITAAAPGGPRYDSSMNSEQRRSAENGIWMCRTHARLIDTDEINYSVEMLKKWKYDAEYEQSCSINGINNDNNSDSRLKTALRKINKDIKYIHSIYTYFMNYYNKNLYMYRSFAEVNDKIMQLWCVHGEKLKPKVDLLYESIAIYEEDYSEYELDLTTELKTKLEEYFSISSFTYQTDNIGLYENYYEELFKMLFNDFNKMDEIINNINYIIEKNYKG